MISVNQALDEILEVVKPLAGERVSLFEASGRVLAEDILSRRDVPPFTNSAMDGYALRHEDIIDATEDSPITLQVLEVIQAGRVPAKEIRAGTASKIMTGAIFPNGANAVVKVEDTSERNRSVLIKTHASKGSNIRNSGEDIRSGQTILKRSRVLLPADIGLLASVGRAFVLVHQIPKVAILSTGDELSEVDVPLSPGQIVNSNAYTLAAAVREAGAQPVPLAIAQDTMDATHSALEEALRHNVVLSTGGVSVGDFDFVKSAMDQIGIKRLFWKIAQKPGKPLTFGVRGDHLYFGLPGNPVSALVCFYLYVAPALRRMAGFKKIFFPTVEVTMAETIKKAKGLTEFIRCKLTRRVNGREAQLTGTQSSGALSSLSLGDSLVIGDADKDVLAKGTKATAIILDREEFMRSSPPF